jgi:hypothetical protein
VNGGAVFICNTNRPTISTAACGGSRWIAVLMLVVGTQEAVTDMTANTSLLNLVLKIYMQVYILAKNRKYSCVVFIHTRLFRCQINQGSF